MSAWKTVQSYLMGSQPVAAKERQASGGKALAGFLLSGFLMALLGAILPAWGYHRDPSDFVAVGNYFLTLALGIVAASLMARRIMAGRGLSFLLVFGCSLSCVSLAYLALVSPPLSAWWRAGGMVSLDIKAALPSQTH